MASALDHQPQSDTQTQPPETPRNGHGHQRAKSGVLKSFIHRRNNSDGSGLPTALLSPPSFAPSPGRASVDVTTSNIVGGPVPRSPSKQHEPSGRLSPSKTFSTFSLKQATTAKDKTKDKQSASLHKPKKTKSITNLATFLSRPKSSKDLQKLAIEDEARARKDKENRTPPSSLNTPGDMERPPIYAQFSSGALEKQGLTSGFTRTSYEGSRGSYSDNSNPSSKKPRPKSYHAQYTSKQTSDTSSRNNNGAISPSKTQRGLKLFTKGLAGSKAEESPAESSEFTIDPRDIDKHLEAMLDRRNIPENQRYKMRSLADSIKMEFIRQDWAESNLTAGPVISNDSDTSLAEVQEKDGSKTKKSWVFTLSKNSGKKSEPNSPNKKKSEGTIGRHFRSRSTDSVVSDRPPSSGSGSIGGGFLSKIKLQQTPADFVAYLRKVQKPELVEVGKLHKLRLLLRNETVAWTDDFVRQGGMEEIVGLLNRIMEVEWREEHEDALLHENLLCLKALCTTGLAMEYLHSIQATLFPSLLHLIFDPEKKGPSEFTTRNIITSILFTYIQSAPPQDRMIRARTVLGHLRDPEPKEEDRPLGFVLEMRRDRPYRIWCKEVMGVTKEVFWIFLHNLNVVFLPRDAEHSKTATADAMNNPLAYLQSHFPQERPPVPAAPYVGGVEWDATNYLTSHLDLLNAIIACTPTLAERNTLRDLLRISGWERCMGGSLRLCKEKFYPGVHDALRTWVAAAAEDGWEVRDVRYGPPPEAKSPVRGGGGANREAKKKAEELPPPKLEMPKLDFGLDGVPRKTSGLSGNWLS
ncbi:armadillo-type protein [Xylariales sp. PMI_506]|nr:armadillo-type protein [Xylariales sp. PMI_506]